MTPRQIDPRRIDVAQYPDLRETVFCVVECGVCGEWQSMFTVGQLVVSRGLAIECPACKGPTGSIVGVVIQ